MNFHQEPRILYIDDEIENLEGFSITFMPYYEVLTSTSAKEGISILNDSLSNDENPISVVITDQRMPEMDGIDFLKEVNKIAPEIIKILLTGYSDIEVITQAINAVNVYKYLSKPWDIEELKSTIERANELFWLKRENNQLLGELKGVNKKLEKSNHQLKDTLKELGFFLYNTSHSFRQPLLSIKGLIGLLAMENDPEVLNSHYRMIMQIIDEYDFFLQNVPELLNKNAIDLEREKIDIRNLIDTNISTHGYLEHFNSTKINVTIENEDIPFYSDTKRINVLLNNLISNAVKFQQTTKKEKKVNIKVSFSENVVSIKVEDNGIGIPSSHIDNIFKMFFRGSENYRGSGLGLYIVKQVLSVLEGSIDVSSKKDGFTCFHVTIPSL